ncbi:MAG: RNA 3'-terminal phosphate cyclase [Candidatus Aenigmarchaeota archaeon]|nr:RNA 3'-terminal phosphate cyclase [Candidatus Aenigmarchaeota archaeon]
MITIDGSYGEGGGQILRTSLALSALLGKSVRIINIRKGRPTPGLKHQHLKSVEIMRELCNAEVKGARLGSTVVEFFPRNIIPKNRLRIDIGTAGSITLLIQTILPVLVFYPTMVEVEIVGGTDVRWSPTIDYLRYVTLKNLERIGVKAYVSVERRGFYPKGGGKVKLVVEPSKFLSPFVAIDRGHVKKVNVYSVAGSLPKHVAIRQMESALNTLKYESKNYDNFELFGSYEVVNSHSRGSSCTVVASCEKSFLGADSLGELGKPAEKVGLEAVEKLLNSLSTGATFDRFMSDQILVFASLADGNSEFSVEELTGHVKTNIYVIEKLVERKIFEVEDKRVKVRGIGFKA